jgi:hypothetical protein
MSTFWYILIAAIVVVIIMYIGCINAPVMPDDYDDDETFNNENNGK